MSRMSGRRKNNPLGLAPRVYMNHGAFYYVHRDGRWEKLGQDIEKANQRARLYNDSQGEYGTIPTGWIYLSWTVRRASNLAG
jgi:hypothetical protein